MHVLQGHQALITLNRKDVFAKTLGLCDLFKLVSQVSEILSPKSS